VAQLRESYSETVDAIGRQFEQLEVVVAQFDPDLDERALKAAWDSDDPVERNRAGLLLGCFEKTHMLLMNLITLSVKLTRRIGAIDDEKTSALVSLVNAGVISQNALMAIEKQREVRNTSQHIYVELSMSELRTVVLDQLETTPGTIQRIAAWVESSGAPPAADA
jgi:uncharacterized protein YutE (UPF0331/DUF86 family)